MGFTVGIVAKAPYNLFEGMMSNLQIIKGQALGSGDMMNVTEKMIVTMAASGTMWGSPVDASEAFTNDSTNNRIVQHMVESEAAFTELVSRDSRAYLSTVSWTNGTTTGLNRNGYTSLSFAAFDRKYVNEGRWWDYTLNQGRKCETDCSNRGSWF